MFAILKRWFIKWLIDDQTIETIIEQLNKEFVEDDIPVGGDDLSLVYFIENTNDGLVKIGVSANPKRRLKSLQSATGNKLRLIATMNGGFEREREIHAMFKEQRKLGEWFTLTEEMLNFILATCDTSYTIKRRQAASFVPKVSVVEIPNAVFEFASYIYDSRLVDDDGAIKKGVTIPWARRGGMSHVTRLAAINFINQIEPPIFFYDESRKWWFVNVQNYPNKESVAKVFGVCG